MYTTVSTLMLPVLSAAAASSEAGLKLAGSVTPGSVPVVM